MTTSDDREERPTHPPAAPKEPAAPPDDHGLVGLADREQAQRRTAAEIALRAERIAFLSDQLRAADRELKESKKQLARAQGELAALRGRRFVRVGLALTARLRRPAGAHGGARSGAGTARSSGTAGSTVDRGPVQTPAAFRADFLARLPRGGARTSEPMHVAIVTARRAGDGGDGVGGPPDDVAAELAAELAAGGWRVSIEREPGVGAPPDAVRRTDVVISTSEGFDIRTLADGTVTVAWVGDDVDPWLGRAWFDEYDIILVPTVAAKAAIDAGSVHVASVVPASDDAGPRARDVVAALEARLAAWAEAARIDIAIGPPDWDVAWRWGDYYFGRALQRAFQRRGHPTRLRLRTAWEAPAAGRADVAIHVFGLVERRTYPGQVSALWIISHPDLVTDEMLEAYEPVFVASDAFAAQLTARTGRAIHPLHQATDPDRFHPADGGPAHDLLFVANSRYVRRPITDELTPTVRDIAVYGRGWTPDLIDPRYVRGEYVPNDRLTAYYAAAKIVLNDHWADMAEHGFMSNRLYDAAASGAFVISDQVAEIDQEFDGGIVTFKDGAELRELVDRYLADPEARAEHARKARASVLARHTFDRRVDEILRVVGPMLSTPPQRDGSPTASPAAEPRRP